MLKKELKIGILAIVVMVAAFFVINFLRGKDLFNKEYEIVSFYEDVQGLLPASPVYIKGYKAGAVSEVAYDTERQGFNVICSVSRDFPVPDDSKMTIYSADLMGGKAVRIELGESDRAAADGAYLEPSVSPDMLSSMASGIEPLISKGVEVLENLDSALLNLNLALSEENRASLRSIMLHLDGTIREVEGIAATLGGKSSEIEDILENLASFSADLDSVGEKADSAMTEIGSAARKLDEADFKGLVENLNALLLKIQDSEGTVGKLINENSVYESLDSLLTGIDRLVRKIEENPKKYLRISVF